MDIFGEILTNSYKIDIYGKKVINTNYKERKKE